MAKETSLIDEIVSLCKRRGVVFQSSEIYGGINGFFDYGPLCVELRRNIKDAWWEDMVRRRDDMVGLDSGIIMNPKVWQASGHVDGFSDPMVDCRESKMRYRADQLFAGDVLVDGDSLGWVCLLESVSMQDEADKKGESMKRKAAKQGTLEKIELRPFDELSSDERSLVPSPATGTVGSLTEPRDFNMMFETNVGALRDASSVAYLRPETAQGIFANFKNIGVDRTFLAVICSAYQIDEIEGEKRTVLRFHPRVAPIKVGVFPLVKNKPELVERARKLYHILQRKWNVIFDQGGAIGRRYRRIDEVGVPFGVTIDFETIEGDGTITLRDRDSTEQERLSEDELVSYLESQINP